MERRSFLQSAVLGGAGASMLNASPSPTFTPPAAPPKMKITRVRSYAPPKLNTLPNQSNLVVTVETDAGITGIGEGGFSKDLVDNCAICAIGQNPFDTDHVWQYMYRGDFYPAGREKLHALGAIDMALWDIKGKALGVPVYQLLGGRARDFIECYHTAGIVPGATRDMPLKERAQATIAAGFRAFRTGPEDVKRGEAYNTHEMVTKTFEACQEIKEGVGKFGDWAIDFHTRFDFADAVRLAKLLEPLSPYFCEDCLRSDTLDNYPSLRGQTSVPLAAGEQWGNKWDFNKLVENQYIDYLRVTLPNVGGITEYMKIASIAETHTVGLIPHFTGAISTVALIHCAASFSGPVLFEWAGSNYAVEHLPQWGEFKEGKWLFNERPGLGVELDTSKCHLLGETTQAMTNRIEYHRPDGSFTEW